MASDGRYRRSNPNAYDHDYPQRMSADEINEAYQQRKSRLAANDDVASSRNAEPRQRTGNRTLVTYDRQGAYGVDRSRQANQQGQSQYPRNRAQSQPSGSRQSRGGSHSQQRSGAHRYDRGDGRCASVNPAGTGRVPAKSGFPVSKHALIASVVFLALFAFTMVSVITGMGWVVPFDEFIGSAVRACRCGFLNPIMRVISFLGATKISAVIILLFCVLLFFKRDKNGLIFFIIMIGVGLGCALACKYLVGRARPTGILLEGAEVDTDVSFPSGHSFTALLLWGLIAVILYVYCTNHGEGGFIKELSKGFAIIWPLIMGFSRLYMGAHFPTDVFAAWALAGFFLTLGASFFLNRFLLDDATRERANPRYRQRSMDRIDYGR